MTHTVAMKTQCHFHLLIIMSGDTLPQLDPTHESMIRAQSAEEGIFIILDRPTCIRTSNIAPANNGFLSALIAPDTFNTDLVSAGDQFVFTIFENVAEGAFATLGASDFAIGDGQFSQSCHISIPYVEKFRTAGRNLELVLQKIMAVLGEWQHDPLATLAHTSKASASITFFRTISSQGIYPIEMNAPPLYKVIAKAVGKTELLEDILVKIERNGQGGPAHRSLVADDTLQNIALRPGERITLLRDCQRITVLDSASSVENLTHIGAK